MLDNQLFIFIEKGILQMRLQSTINTVLVPSIPAKVKRKPKKYTELLEGNLNNEKLKNFNNKVSSKFFLLFNFSYRQQCK